jgi:hypothetical protein
MKLQLDTLIETLGKPGKYQLGLFFLLACNYFPIVFNIVIMAFFGFTPKHSCVSDTYGSLSGDNNSAISYVNRSGKAEFGACVSTYYLTSGVNKTVTCSNDPGSHYEYKTEELKATIVSEVLLSTLVAFSVFFDKTNIRHIFTRQGLLIHYLTESINLDL